MLSVAPPAQVAARRNTTVDVKLALTVAPGFHVNSNTPSDEYLIPLRLTWTPGALEAAGVTYPKPTLEKYEFSQKPLSVYTGKIDLDAKLKVPPHAPLGMGMMVGKVRYQACNDKMCFPPKTVEVRLPYDIK
jgi:hypothetical protein